MKGLLFFASDYKIGLSSLLTQQAIALKKGDLNPFCLAGENEQEPGLIDQMKENGVNLTRIKGLDEHAYFSDLSEQIGSLIVANDIQCVHVQNNWQLLLVSYYKYRSIIPKPIKIIYTLHGFRHNHVVKSILAILLIGFILFFFADRIFVMSEYVKKKFNFLSYKIKKVYLGIDSSYFEKRENKMNIESLRLIFPAQFRKGKNQYMLINAVAAYVKETSDKSIELYLPGEGVLLENCKQLSLKEGIDNQVYFPGICTKKQIKDIYEKCNIGVISSNSETFGQSIAESYVLGRCVLTKRVGVAMDEINEGKNGYFFETEEDLINLLIMLSTNKEKIKEIGDTNFKQRAIFSWESYIKLYKIELR